MGNLKEEVEKTTQVHETTISDIKKKDQVIAEYRSKTEMCRHVLEIVQKARTLAGVIFEVI